jgi:hypothetical protein
MRLKSTRRKNGLSAISAFFRVHKIKRTSRCLYNYIFEHGQLWIKHRDGAIWSVVDAEGVDTWNGYGFEQVSDNAH